MFLGVFVVTPSVPFHSVTLHSSPLKGDSALLVSSAHREPSPQSRTHIKKEGVLNCDTPSSML